MARSTAHPVRRNSKRSTLAVVLLSLALVFVSATGLVAGLWTLGIVNLSFLNRMESRVGLVQVPMSNRPIPAFTKLTRDHVADPKTGGINMRWLPEDKLSPDVIRDPARIVGRVLSHDKLGDYAFVEEDFMPVGTRPGLVGGTPPGKRSLTLDAEYLSGVHGLRAGDHIDLMASSPIDLPQGGSRNESRNKGMAAQAEMAKMRKRAAVHMLAQDAVVVMPVTTRAKPVTVGSLMNGAQSKTVPVQEMVVAVDPDEVAPIGEAITMHIGMTCVIRSGHPDDPGAAVETPGADPLDDTPLNVVESIQGSKRDTLVFSDSGTRVKLPTEETDRAETAKPAGMGLRMSGMKRLRQKMTAANAE